MKIYHGDTEGQGERGDGKKMFCDFSKWRLPHFEKSQNTLVEKYESNCLAADGASHYLNLLVCSSSWRVLRPFWFGYSRTKRPQHFLPLSQLSVFSSEAGGESFLEFSGYKDIKAIL